MTRPNSSAVTSVKGANTLVMALFTHMSMGPSSSSTREAAVSTCAASATSVGTTRALPLPGSPQGYLRLLSSQILSAHSHVLERMLGGKD